MSVPGTIPVMARSPDRAIPRHADTVRWSGDHRTTGNFVRLRTLFDALRFTPYNYPHGTRQAVDFR